MSDGAAGLHWEELDEDLSVEHLLLGMGDNTNLAKHLHLAA
jgi:hypothetical protein